MQAISTWWLGHQAYFLAHPELLVLVLTGIVWPFLSGVASFFDARLAAKWPTFAAFLTHSGFSAKGSLQILWNALSRKLPIPPLPILIVFPLLLGGCAPSLRNGVVASVNAAADFGTGAEKVLADLDRTEQQACVVENSTPELRTECAAAVHARFHTAWNVYREYEIAWAASAATVRAYDAATAAARAPDAASLLKAATSLADATEKLRAAFEGLKALVAPAGSVNAAKIGGVS